MNLKEYIVEYYICKPKIEYKLENVDEEELNRLKERESQGEISIISIVHILYGELRG